MYGLDVSVFSHFLDINTNVFQKMVTMKIAVVSSTSMSGCFAANFYSLREYTGIDNISLPLEV